MTELSCRRNRGAIPQADRHQRVVEKHRFDVSDSPDISAVAPYPGCRSLAAAMAQTAAVMVGVTLGLTEGNLLIYFMSIDGCKFRRKVVPGDVLEMKVETVRGKPGAKVWRFKGRAEVDGEMAAEAEFMAMMDMQG